MRKSYFRQTIRGKVKYRRKPLLTLQRKPKKWSCRESRTNNAWPRPTGPQQSAAPAPSPGPAGPEMQHPPPWDVPACLPADGGAGELMSELREPARELMSELREPVDVWLHGVTMLADLPPSAAAACSRCAADPGTELLSCCGCGDRYHLYCVEEWDIPCSEEAQIYWRCRRCRAVFRADIDCSVPVSQPTESTDSQVSSVPSSPVLPAPLEPVASAGSMSPPYAVLEPLQPVLACWSGHATSLRYLPGVWSPRAFETGARTPGLLQETSGELSDVLQLRLEDLVNSDRRRSYVAVTVPDAWSSDSPAREQTDSDSTEEASKLSEVGEDFCGFVKSEVLETMLAGKGCLQGSGSNDLQRPRKRRQRRKKLLSFGTNSYNLRRGDDADRKSYRLTKARKKREYRVKQKEVDQLPSDANSKSVGPAAADDGESLPVVYTVPLQYQLLDVEAALELLQEPPAPQPSAEVAEAAALGCPAGVEEAVMPDMLERLRQSVQVELDLLGYPAPLPPSARRRGTVRLWRGAIPDCMLEDEWQTWRRLMPPRRGRPRKYPRPDDLSWILQMKQLGVQVDSEGVVLDQTGLLRAVLRRARVAGRRARRTGSSRPRWANRPLAEMTQLRRVAAGGHLPGRSGRRRLSAALRHARRLSAARVPAARGP